MCSNPVAVRLFRNCGQKILLLFECFGTADKRLFCMDSKGHVRHFFGVRFAYSMCSNPAAVRVFRNCGQKIVFYGFQRSREALFRRAFCLACARILLLFECFGTADKRLFFYGFQRSREALFRRAFCFVCARILLLFECFGTADKRLFFMDSKSHVRLFFGVRILLLFGQKIVFYGFQRSREALFRRAFCLPCARILLLFECFGTAGKRLFFMDSKGHVRHFFGVRFAYHVLESCCCSSVSELRTKDCFLWIPKVA